jgi:carotenoid cleavage dioxygenase
MEISRRDFLSASAAGAGLMAWGRFCFAEPQQGASQPTNNPFLSENFAPVREEITADDLKVIGKLPPGLNGMFVRNGPNPQFPPKLNYHWFDGDGMLHGVRIQDGKASYRNRWVRTAGWYDENKAGKAIYPSVLDPPDVKVFLEQFLKGELPYPNRANTALVWHHGKLLALWEGGPPHEIKVPNLETAGPYTFGARLKHAFTAHPKVDPKTGELMFFGYSPVPPFLQYSVAKRDGTIKSTTPIELPRAVMMHDMAITEKYSLFIDCPAVFDPTAILRSKPFLNYEPKHGARIGVLPRYAKGEEIKWFEIETCFIFHIFNAYEDGDDILLYGCRYGKYPEIVDFDGPVQSEGFEENANASSPIAHRWRMNMKTGAVNEEPLDELNSEFPRVNEGLTGAKTKYGYAVSGTSRSSSFLKYDFERGTRQKHNLGKGHITGEGVFVPRPDPKTEDDGWLVSLTHDQVEGRSELRVIDCRDLTADPIARVQIPQRVPYGFHGLWLPSDHV